MPIMEEAPFPSVKARPASESSHVELASHLPAGFNGDKKEGVDDDNDEAEEEEEENEIGDEPSYGTSSSPCSSSPCGSPRDGSHSLQWLRELHAWPDVGSLGLIDDGYMCSTSPYVYADVKHPAFSYHTAEDASLGAMTIMEKLVKAGADGFVRAVLRTSFLASCVWACQSRTRDLIDTVSILGERLHERLEECSGDESSDEAVEKIKRMTEWALECIVLHCQSEMRGHVREVCPSTPLGAQFQLRAFERFLELAENRLSGEDYMEAFEAACFPLSLFSFVLDVGWVSGIAAIAMQGLLGMLVEGGADNVNQCCLEAARSGITELLRMLLQIAQRNGIEVDVDVALGYASHHCKLGTMECLVDVGNAAAFLDPFIRASDRGCMPVVQWFVEKGCQDAELCWGLTAAVSSNRVEVAEYLLKCIPPFVLRALSLDIVKAVVEHSGSCLKGVAFLFQHDFLGCPEATYEVANRVAKLEDGLVSHELKRFCKHEWSHTAFIRGRQAGTDHYLNVQRVLCRSSSALKLKELPPQLQVAIAYLPLYRECAESCGLLLSQWLRGQLIEAASRLTEDQCSSAERLMKYDKSELVALLKARLPTFFVEKY